MPDLPPLLCTRRLDLRGWKDDDATDLVGIKTDPMNWRYITGGQPLSRLEAFRLVSDLRREWMDHGIGSWALEVLPSRGLIGDCGIKVTDQGPQLAYMIRADMCGNGFATEAAQAVLGYTFLATVWESVFASAHVDNAASRAVLRKIGMREVGTREGRQGPESWYEIRRDDWTLREEEVANPNRAALPIFHRSGGPPYEDPRTAALWRQRAC